MKTNETKITELKCKEVVLNGDRYRVFDDAVYWWNDANQNNIFGWVQINLNSEFAKPIVEMFGLQEQARKDLGVENVEQITVQKFLYEKKETIVRIGKGFYVIVGEKPYIVKNEHCIAVLDSYFDGENDK